MNNSFYKQQTATTGFPNPSKDYDISPLDLNSHLIIHPAATFIMKVDGEGLARAKIFTGDLVIVDRSLLPFNSAPVVANIDNDFKIAIYTELGDKKYLWREKLIPITEDSFIWGVIRHTIHSFDFKIND